MGTGRLEAFSDGVIAIIVTIMVLELKAPHGTGFDALLPVIPVFLSYVLSFIYVGIYWNNHHHMLHAAESVSGAGLWANLHLLFWLSLIPFTTAWMDENHFEAAPVALYGFILLMASVAYYILARVLIRDNGPDSRLAKAVGKDFKGRISVAIYVAGIAISLWQAWLAVAIYVLAAVMWIIPDRRIEK
jgi:uncharacterized membrane protein